MRKKEIGRLIWSERDDSCDLLTLEHLVPHNRVIWCNAAWKLGGDFKIELLSTCHIACSEIINIQLENFPTGCNLDASLFLSNGQGRIQCNIGEYTWWVCCNREWPSCVSPGPVYCRSFSWQRSPLMAKKNQGLHCVILETNCLDVS